jgi:hypothetical protein
MLKRYQDGESFRSYGAIERTDGSHRSLSRSDKSNYTPEKVDDYGVGTDKF